MGFSGRFGPKRAFFSECSALCGGEMIEEKVRRDVFEVVDLHASDDTVYWRDRSYTERIEAIEFMRKVMFGHDRVSERLQRILTVTELKAN
jgi:hypothetical protein